MITLHANQSDNISIENPSIYEKERWNSVISEVPTNSYYDFDYAFAMHKASGKIINLLCIKNLNNDSCLLLTYIKRTKDERVYDIYSPYGFGGVELIGGDLQEIISAFYKWLNKENIITLFGLSFPTVNNSEIAFNDHKTTIEIDLEKGIENFWSEMDYNHKYEINKTQKKSAKFQLIFNLDDRIDEFTKLYEESLERVSASSTYYFGFDAIEHLINSKITRSIGVLENDELVAAIVFLVKNGRADYFINAASSKGRSYTRFLIWKLINNINEKDSVKRLNLGGGVDDFDNLFRFKKKFGGEEKTIKAVKLVVNETKYKQKCEEYSQEQTNNSFFPPYWN